MEERSTRKLAYAQLYFAHKKFLVFKCAFEVNSCDDQAADRPINEIQNRTKAFENSAFNS